MGRNWTGNNRAPWHDYTQRQIYHLTLMKAPGIMPFGCIAGDWRIPRGCYGRSYLKASAVGCAVKDCLRAIHTVHPALKVLQYALMPDHLHILLSIEDILDEVLGRKIAVFKVMVNKRANMESVFAKGFNDQILTTSRNLDIIYDYLRDNPFRLAVRYAHPEFFNRINNIEIGGKVYPTYGNYQLLKNPFKDQVVIHRADGQDIRKANYDRWLHTASNGGVLVSPFISKDEKMVRVAAESLGGKVILIIHEAFGERYKPAAHDFDLCVEGGLLIISLGMPAGTPLSRSACLQMNALAQKIAGM